jgi:hypothetical protein
MSRTVGRGLTDGMTRLQKLKLKYCFIDAGLSNLLEDILDLRACAIYGTQGGQQLLIVVAAFLAVKVLIRSYNNLGPAGARALAPGLGVAAAYRLESLHLVDCSIEMMAS